MIGALPAVAVRHERRRQEKRRRPSQLALQLGRSGNSPSPTPSPPGHRHYESELYVCGKVAVLHAVVGSILLGIVVMVVGLVQLSPGAEAAQHRYYLMGAGAALMGAGLVGAVLRCLCIHWYNRKMHPVPPEAQAAAPHAAPAAPAHHAKNGVDAKHVRHAPVDHAPVDHAPPLKSQKSVTSPPPRHDPAALDVLVRQPAPAHT